MIARKRKIGERVGHAPFGYIYQRRKLVPSDPEMQTVELIREKRLEEEMSYHRIAKLLNSRRILSKRGRRWYAETIKTVCENPLYGTPISQQKTISEAVVKRFFTCFRSILDDKRNPVYSAFS